MPWPIHLPCIQLEVPSLTLLRLCTKQKPLSVPLRTQVLEACKAVVPGCGWRRADSIQAIVVYADSTDNILYHLQWPLDATLEMLVERRGRVYTNAAHFQGFQAYEACQFYEPPLAGSIRPLTGCRKVSRRLSVSFKGVCCFACPDSYVFKKGCHEISMFKKNGSASLHARIFYSDIVIEPRPGVLQYRACYAAPRVLWAI